VLFLKFKTTPTEHRRRNTLSSLRRPAGTKATKQCFAQQQAPPTLVGKDMVNENVSTLLRLFQDYTRLIWGRGRCLVAYSISVNRPKRLSNWNKRRSEKNGTAGPLLLSIYSKLGDVDLPFSTKQNELSELAKQNKTKSQFFLEVATQPKNVYQEWLSGIYNKIRIRPRLFPLTFSCFSVVQSNVTRVMQKSS